MRPFAQQIDTFKQLMRDIFGPQAVVRLFGSGLDDPARPGNVDLHVDCNVSIELPELAIIRLSAACLRAMPSRRVCDSQIGLISMQQLLKPPLLTY